MLILLALTHFIIHTYSQIIPALIPTLKQELGINLVQASLLLSIPMMVNVIANIPAGILADRIGSRILAVCFLVNIIGAALIIVSKNFILLIVGAGLLSVASTLYHPPSLKASSTLNPEKMNLIMAAHLAGGTTGIATGPILMGLLMPFFGWRSAFLFWIPVNIIFSIVSYYQFRGIEETTKKERKNDISVMMSLKSLMTMNLAVAILAAAFMEVAVMNLSSFIATYFQEDLGMSESLASLVYGLGPLTGLVGAFVGGSIGDRFGLYISSIGILVVEIFLIGIIPFTNIFLNVTILYIVYRGLFASMMPLTQSIIANNSPVENRSLAFSTSMMIASIGASISPIITSFLAEIYDISIIFPFSIILIIPSIGLYFSLYRKKIS
jgi:MFS family permease